MVDDDWLESNADPEAVAPWRALGAHSLLMLPLTSPAKPSARSRSSAPSPSGFDADRRALAEKYATSAATALENARLYDSAQRANRARDEVLGIVSHDLRNPISAIAMCARVLEENPPADPAERAELLETIRESTDWVNRLIEDLLDVANIERGRLSLELRPHEPSQIALQAMHMFEVEARQHGIALEAHLPTNLPLVAADGARVVQVLGNLLRNAIKFTPREGSVVIAVEPRDSGVLFSVTDTGPGIGAERQGRVFDRYWQIQWGPGPAGAGWDCRSRRESSKPMADASGWRAKWARGACSRLRFHRASHARLNSEVP